MEPKTYAIIVGKRGTITIPSEVREQHSIQEGDIIRITSNGQGQEIILEVFQADKLTKN